ncbi:MAG: hypothetical protein IJF11_03235 [Clostridia bacterium]|nr:hypothetical protein [Clostridia bacterium]
MNKISIKLQKLIVWLTGYLNVIAFFLAGGYIFLKTEHEDVRKSAKTAFFTLAIFTAIDLLTTVLSNIFSLSQSYDAYNTITKARVIISVVRVVIFVVLMALDIAGIHLAKKQDEDAPAIVEDEQSENE